MDDFEWYDPENGDHDFVYTQDDDYVSYGEVPEEVRELLDAIIEKRMNTAEN